MIDKIDIQTFHETYRILAYADKFIYLLPHHSLQNLISNYTITFPNENMFTSNYSVIPHGSATLVFSFTGIGLHGTLFGPSTKLCAVGKQANQSKVLFIIEFQPAGLYAFTGIRQKELSDKIIPFELINPPLFKLIKKALESAENIVELIGCIDKLLLVNPQSIYLPEFNSATQLIINSVGSISIKELSDSVFYSERHLNRIFDEYLGMNAKIFSRLVRVNKAIRYLHSAGTSITRISILAGFYDLPHFVHDFKLVCGITPQEYRYNMSDFYSEIAKF